MRPLLVFALLFVAAALPPPAHAEPLTNADVTKLVEAGLSSDVVIAKIKGSPTDFDTSIDALIALKEAGIPQDVIAAMAAGPDPARQAAPAAPGQPQEIVVRTGASSAANVATRFEGTPCPSPGIFLETGSEIEEIDPTTYKQSKSGGHFLSAITYGAKSVKSKAILGGTSARIQIRDPNSSFHGTTNPSEFLLVALTVNRKKGHRELITGKLNVWRGAEAGAPPKSVRGVAYEKLAAGGYRVTLETTLPGGEYGFYYAGSAPLAIYGMAGAGSGNKIFAFGVGS